MATTPGHEPVHATHMAPLTLRVVLVDDHPLYRFAVENILSRSGRIQIVGTAGTGADGVAAVRAEHPDVLLLDVRLPDLDGLAVLEQIVRIGSPPSRVLMLSADDSPSTVATALALGAAGYVLKEIDEAGLCRAVVAAARGELVLPRRLEREVLTARLADRAGHPTPRQLEVLKLAARGHSRLDIARRLFVSEATVKADLRSLYSKLRVPNRAAAVAEAARRGLLGSDPSS